MPMTAYYGLIGQPPKPKPERQVIVAPIPPAPTLNFDLEVADERR